MAKITIKTKEMEAQKLEVGQFFEYEDGEIYILAQSDYDQFALISLNDGVRYGGPKGKMENVFLGDDNGFTRLEKGTKFIVEV